ncbi:MAG: hypothetical protein AAB472_00125 [Patescibacteria group bacterium]
MGRALLGTAFLFVLFGVAPITLAATVPEALTNNPGKYGTGWTCTSEISFGSTVYTCTNPAGSTATCTAGGGAEAAVSDEGCTAKDASGKLLGSTGSQNNYFASTTTNCAANGSCTSETSSVFPDVFGWLADSFLAVTLYPLSYAVFTLAGWILTIVGVVFNWTIIKTVFEFAQYFGNSEGLLIAWGVLRDVGNIVLLFGFIFMGVSTILNLERSEFTAKRALPALIIFAILLNFSLFAAEAVIDVANGFSSVLAEQAGTNCTGADSTTCANEGISGQIMQLTGGSTFLGFRSDPSTTGSSPLEKITLLLIYSLLITIVAIVLLAGTIMLISRAVVLVFLIVTSPIGFAGMAVPLLHKLAERWWSLLLNESFFAPVYLLLILISIKIGSGLGTTGDLGQAVAGGAVAGASQNLQAFVLFFIVIGFMMMSLIASRRMGVLGSNFAVNSASALVFGTMTRGTNLAVGGYAYGLQRFQQKTGFGGKVGQVAVNRILRPLQSANLDARRLPLAQTALGLADIKAGAIPSKGATFSDTRHVFADAKSGTYGKGLKKKYDDEVAFQKLEDEARAGALSAETTTFLNGLSEEQLLKSHAVQEGGRAVAEAFSDEKIGSLLKYKDTPEDLKARLLDNRHVGIRESLAIANDATKAPPIRTAARDAANAAIKKLGERGFEQIAQSKASASLLSDYDFVSVVREDQADKVGSNKNIAQSVRDGFQQARDDRFNDPVRARVTIDAMSDDALKKIPEYNLKKTDTLNALTASGRINNIDFGKLSANTMNDVRNHLFSVANAPNTLNILTNESVSKLPTSVIEQNHVIRSMRGEQLAALDPNKLSGTAITNIRNLITAPGAPSPEVVRFDALTGMTSGVALNPDAGRRWGGII